VIPCIPVEFCPLFFEDNLLPHSAHSRFVFYCTSTRGRPKANFTWSPSSPYITLPERPRSGIQILLVSFFFSLVLSFKVCWHAEGPVLLDLIPLPFLVLFSPPTTPGRSEASAVGWNWFTLSNLLPFPLNPLYFLRYSWVPHFRALALSPHKVLS